MTTAFQADAFQAVLLAFQIDELVSVGKTGGKGDNEKRRILRTIKPTGLTHAIPSGVEQRVDESLAIHAEVTERVAREFTEENARAIERLTQAEVTAEISRLVKIAREKQNQDEEIVMLLVTAALLH